MKYTVWKYQEAGFGHGWRSEQADTIPEGAVSASSFEARDADRKAVHVVENAAVEAVAPAEKEEANGDTE